MLLTDYIDSVYGTARGNRARFLKDNPDILPQELCRKLSLQKDKGDAVPEQQIAGN